MGNIRPSDALFAGRPALFLKRSLLETDLFTALPQPPVQVGPDIGVMRFAECDDVGVDRIRFGKLRKLSQVEPVEINRPAFEF